MITEICPECRLGYGQLGSLPPADDDSMDNSVHNAQLSAVAHPDDQDDEARQHPLKNRVPASDAVPNVHDVNPSLRFVALDSPHKFLMPGLRIPFAN